MQILSKKSGGILILGDICILFISVWLSLCFRNIHIPSKDAFVTHIVPFSILFAVWVFVFFLSGLYGRYTTLFRRALPTTIVVAQIINIAFASFFFFVIPFFGITPKTVLIIYLIISTTLLFLWRLYLYPLTHTQDTIRTVFIGDTVQFSELCDEIHDDSFYPVSFDVRINTHETAPQEARDTLHTLIKTSRVDAFVVDTSDEKNDALLSFIYADIGDKMSRPIIDAVALYQDVFEKIPLFAVNHIWFAHYFSKRTHVLYDLIKRIVDFVFALVFGLVSLVFYPIIMIAIFIDSGTPFFFSQKRVGQFGKEISIIKFRTMIGIDTQESALKSTLHVTRVGNFLRKTRLDELPQLVNVLLGQLSLVGPRPEIQTLVAVYGTSIPFYYFRHTVKPGLSGWAQIKHDAHPHHGVDTDATAEKLSYDLYYIKKRSLWLDANIIFSTIKILVTKKGR